MGDKRAGFEACLGDLDEALSQLKAEGADASSLRRLQDLRRKLLGLQLMTHAEGPEQLPVAHPVGELGALQESVARLEEKVDTLSLLGASNTVEERLTRLEERLNPALEVVIGFPQLLRPLDSLLNLLSQNEGRGVGGGENWDALSERFDHLEQSVSDQRKTMKGVAALVSPLRKLIDVLEGLKTRSKKLEKTVNELSDQLTGGLQSIEALAGSKADSSERLNRIQDSLQGLEGSLRKLRRQVDGFVRNRPSAAARVTRALGGQRDTKRLGSLKPADRRPPKRSRESDRRRPARPPTESENMVDTQKFVEERPASASEELRALGFVDEAPPNG